MECQLEEDQHLLKVYMSDDKHEIEVQMSVSTDGKRVDNIRSRCMRTPFEGICCRPYQKISLLEGVSIDRDFRTKVIEVGGGEKGCVHFADFILDMVRYRKQVCEIAGLAG